MCFCIFVGRGAGSARATVEVGLVDGKIPASQQIYNAIYERKKHLLPACTELLVTLIGVRAQQADRL